MYFLSSAAAVLWLQGSHWLSRARRFCLLHLKLPWERGKWKTVLSFHEAEAQHLPRGWVITNCCFRGASFPGLIPSESLGHVWGVQVGSHEGNTRMWSMEKAVTRVVWCAQSQHKETPFESLVAFLVILLKIKASGNYSRLEKSVSVGEGLGAREGGKEGPCGCHLHAAEPRRGAGARSSSSSISEIRVVLWSVRSCSLPWRMNPWQWQGGKPAVK